MPTPKSGNLLRFLLTYRMPFKSGNLLNSADSMMTIRGRGHSWLERWKRIRERERQPRPDPKVMAQGCRADFQDGEGDLQHMRSTLANIGRCQNEAYGAMGADIAS